MNRKEEVKKKTTLLLHAFACCPTEFDKVLLSKYFELKRYEKSLSPESAEIDATASRAHKCAAAGIVISHTGDATLPLDIHTGLPITWGELIKRMNP